MDNQITKESLAKKIISIISGALRLDESKIYPSSRIINDLNAESLDILDIRFSIEQEWGLKIGEHEFVEKIGNGMTPAEFMEIFTVSSLIDFVEGKTGLMETEK